MEIPAAIKKKYGPLPLWAWGLIALALVYGAMMYRNRNANASAFGNQAPKSNLGTTTDNSAGGGSLSPPFTEVAQSNTPPPYISPVVTDTSAPAVAPLQSAVITDPVLAASVAPTPTQESMPAAIAAAGDQPYNGPLSYGQPGYVIDPSTGQVYGPSTAVEGGIRQRVGQPVLPDAVDRYLANVAGYDPINGTFPNPQTLAATPPPPTPVTVKTLPAPVEPTPTPIRGRNIAV